MFSKKSQIFILSVIVSILSLKAIAMEDPMTDTVNTQLIKELVTICKQNAIDDEIEKKDIEVYTFECVNEELVYSNLKQITKKEFASHYKKVN